MLTIKHKGTNDHYLIVGRVRIKDPSTRVWCSGFAYISVDNPRDVNIRYAQDLKATFDVVGATHLDIKELVDDQN